MLPKGPGDEDLNAIENEFYTYKGKAKTRQFLPNKVLDLYLGIVFGLRSEIENYIEDNCNSESGPVGSQFFTSIHPNSHANF